MNDFNERPGNIFKKLRVPAVVSCSCVDFFSLEAAYFYTDLRSALRELSGLAMVAPLAEMPVIP